MTKDEIINVVNKLDASIGVEFFTHNTIAGKAFYQENKVAFNTKLMHNEGFMNTVLHEVAHIFTERMYPNAMPHGKEWKAVMLRLNAVPNTYHTYPTTKAKRTLTRIVGICSCKEHLFTVQAAKKSWTCKLCAGKIRITEEVRKISNQ
jgi:predicted SprT family Zn-dependent metalloprotease